MEGGFILTNQNIAISEEGEEPGEKGGWENEIELDYGDQMPFPSQAELVIFSDLKK